MKTIAMNQLRVNEYCGVVHIHTTFSDGGVTYPELVNAAKNTGLDYVVVNDHMTLQGKHAGCEGFAGNVMVVVGYEHHDYQGLNHYLVLGTDAVLQEQAQPQEYVDGVRERGGIGFIAHPMERRHYFKKYPPFPWTEWDVTGYDGIEIWNQMSEWVENLRRWTSYVRVLYPRRFLSSIRPELCAKWDELNRERFVAGLGGVDAHTFKFKAGPFRIRIFPIKVELKGVRTHLYLTTPLPRDNWPAAERQFLDALRDGRGYVSNYRRGDASGTSIFLETQDGSAVLPGRAGSVVLPPARIHVRVPQPAEIRLVCNGELLDCAKGERTEFAVDSPGVYRVEVFRRARAWVYSNPFPVGRYPL
ncbi:MAG: histidinol-phosphatase [Chitinivibrionales bacterium]|nr:histidinol-phosphatase [Chitinivibrionales bacterium]MBD3394084.1 histidinol-phosphatase [Chitinivibrionales bacterium]